MPTLKPMLADSINITDLPKYIKDDAWWMQPKADGHRFLIEVNDGVVSVSNRSGMPKVTGSVHPSLDELKCFDEGHWIFDGELVGDTLLLFDLPQAGSLTGPATPFEERFETLTTLVEMWGPDPARIQALPCAKTPYEKEAMFRSALDGQREGVMLRLRSGVYLAGRRSWLLKCKFVKEADCIITATGLDGHNNVELSLLDLDDRYPKAHKKTMPNVAVIGRASANGKNPIPRKGDVWETRFLYVVDRQLPRLYQPRLVRRRSFIDENDVAQGDKFMDECLVDQIEHCFTDKNLTDRSRTER